MENNIPEQTLNEDSMLRPISIRPIMNAEGRIDDDQPVNESAGLWRDYREGKLIDIKDFNVDDTCAFLIWNVHR